MVAWKREKREGSFTYPLVTQILSAATGASLALPTTTGALETAAGVVHPMYSRDPQQPWSGVGPIQSAGLANDAFGPAGPWPARLEHFKAWSAAAGRSAALAGLMAPEEP